MAIVGIRRQPPLAGASCDPDDLRLQVQARLAEVAPAHDGLLSTAAREALLGQGKRVRPVLAMLAAAHVGGTVGVSESAKVKVLMRQLVPT